MDDGSGSFADILLDGRNESDRGGDSNTTARNSSTWSGYSYPTRKTTSSYSDDIAPVHVLQPREIVHNIDLMKTVGILLETRYQSSADTRRLDLEKLVELQNDIERFPEAFQKFATIIHQIQYLNCTYDWNASSCQDSLPSLSASARSGTSFMSRLFSSDEPPTNPERAEKDARKEVLLHLLQMVQHIFSKYLKIQILFENRLKKFRSMLVSAEQVHRQRTLPNNTASDSDNDDPNMPLLVANLHPRLEHGLAGVCAWQGRTESMNEILKNTKRNSGEVQDSMRELNDIILWDYKEAIKPKPPRTTDSEWPAPTNIDEGQEAQVSDSNGYSVNGGSRDYSPGMTDEVQMSSRRNRRRMWRVAMILAGVLILLILVAMLSFLRFKY